MFDCFLAKCQEGLNLPEMLDEHISVCKRDIIQNQGESAADFAAWAESAMSLFEELPKGSGFTNAKAESTITLRTASGLKLSLRD